MKTIRDIYGYDTCVNYRLLWKIAQKQSVICIVDYAFDRKEFPTDPIYRDVAHTIKRSDGELAICCRGVEYITANSFIQFNKQCAFLNVEFIPPKYEKESPC
jgi:hypothetical protein